MSRTEDPFAAYMPYESRRPVNYRSVSQVKMYEQCGYSYYLSRRLRAWEKPAAWLPQGTSVHSGVEAWEKSGGTMPRDEVLALVKAEYIKSVNGLLRETPNTNYWFNSGPHNGAADIDRRMVMAEEHIGRYLDYREGKARDRVIWTTPDGQPGIELGFDVDLDGVQVKGYIDQVREDGVWDVKTGNSPGDVFQLKTYAVALEEQYGATFDRGGFIMTKNKRDLETIPLDLTVMSKGEVVDRFGAADEGIRNERFDPKPGDACNRCPVASACEFAKPTNKW